MKKGVGALSKRDHLIGEVQFNSPGKEKRKTEDREREIHTNIVGKKGADSL